MQLSELTVRGFADLLGSDAPAPGGGSAAALAGALGAALTAMVGSLTVGKKKYAEFDGLARETLEKARDLEHRFLDVMQRDTEAFNAVSAVFAMPKGTDEEKTARSQAMQQALQGCTRTPFEMMELSLEALRLTEGLVDRSNANAASDLGCAALHLGVRHPGGMAQRPHQPGQHPGRGLCRPVSHPGTDPAGRGSAAVPADLWTHPGNGGINGKNPSGLHRRDFYPKQFTFRQTSSGRRRPGRGSDP